jgi:hypothetical protein
MAQTKKPRPATKVVGGKAQDTAAMNEKITAAERRIRRAAEAKAMQQQRQRRNLLIGAAGALVLLLVAGYFIRDALANQNIGTAVASEGEGHVNVGETLTFNRLPPSSGKHYPTAQPAGIYRQEVQEGFWVHSLEHGYVVAAVKCTTDCDAIFNQLEEINKSLPESQFGNVKLIATPYSKTATDGDAKITLLAWGYEQKLDSVDKDIITRFYKKFVDKGPELVP